MPSRPLRRRVVAVRDADADVEDAVAAREDPAVAGPQPRCQTTSSAGDARRPSPRSSRSRAARRRSACAARTCRRRSAPAARAAGEHDPGRADLVRRGAGFQPRADDARRPLRSGAAKRTGGSMRGAGVDRRAAEDRRRASCAAAPPACPARRRARRAARCSRRGSTACACAITSSSTPSRRSAACASGISPSPQTLSRGKACWSSSTTSTPARASLTRAGAARRAGADDEHVAARRHAGGGTRQGIGHRYRSKGRCEAEEYPAAPRLKDGRARRRGSSRRRA